MNYQRVEFVKKIRYSILKRGKAKAVRLSTLDAICRELQCTSGDILEYREEDRAS